MCWKAGSGGQIVITRSFEGVHSYREVGLSGAISALGINPERITGETELSLQRPTGSWPVCRMLGRQAGLRTTVSNTLVRGILRIFCNYT